MNRVKVGRQGQIAIPADLRKKLGIQPRDCLLVDVHAGYVVLMPEPVDSAQHLLGLHKEVWEGVDA